MKKIFLISSLILSFSAFAENDIQAQAKSDIQAQIDEISRQAEVRQAALDRLAGKLSKEFSDNLVQRKNEFAEIEKKQAEAKAALARKPNARIGMSASQVRNKTNWGKPYSINQTITANGTREQWVYGDEYLYFTNGRLTAIQTSR